MKMAPPPGPVRPNILFYGPPKTGKTAGACSAPGGIFLFNTDLPNASRFARSKKRDPEGRVMEPAIPIQDATNRTPVLDLMGEISNAVVTPVDQNLVAAVVTDPISELYRRLLEELSTVPGSRPTINPSLQTRLATTTYIERYCRFLCEAPSISAIFVCHESTVKDESSDSFERLPFTGTSNPNLGSKLLGMVDIVAYTGIAQHEDGSKSYMAQLVNARGRRGGDRFDCLGDSAPLDLKQWFATIERSEVIDGQATDTTSEVATLQQQSETHPVAA